MKTKLLIACALLAAFPVFTRAQGTTNDMENDFGARVSVSVDKKLMKGLHLEASGEARMSENLSDFGRYQAGLGISYKISSTFKVGAGYNFIQVKNSSDEWKPRHRFYVDGMVGFRSGYWRFSLKERLQYTHREVNNKFQKVPNSLALKSRFKVSYKGAGVLEPYGYIEIRNVFNDPACSATWSTSSQAYSDYEFLGYNDAYVNRLRGCLGIEWSPNKIHGFDFFVLGDYYYDKEIDTNAEGTKLKSLTYDHGMNIGLGIGYTFNF